MGDTKPLEKRLPNGTRVQINEPGSPWHECQGVITGVTSGAPILYIIDVPGDKASPTYNWREFLIILDLD